MLAVCLLAECLLAVCLLVVCAILAVSLLAVVRVFDCSFLNGDIFCFFAEYLTHFDILL